MRRVFSLSLILLSLPPFVAALADLSSTIEMRFRNNDKSFQFVRPEGEDGT